MSSELPVDGFMQQNLLECAPATPLAQAAASMRDAACGSILVVEDGVAVGIWTEVDALKGELATLADLNQPISSFMSAPVQTIPLGTLLGEAARRFHQKGVRHLLVTDAAGRHVGMLSQTDVVRHQGVAFFVHARPVASIIHAVPLSVDAATPFVEMRAQMLAQGVDAVLVPDGPRWGIVTTRDVVRALGAGQLTATAGELASFPLQTVCRDATLFQARELFEHAHVRHLGVTGDGGALVGLLTFRDILENVVQEYVDGLLGELEQQAEHLLQTRREVIRQASLTEAIIDALPINVFVKDEAGKLLLVNEMAAQTIGRPRSDIVGRTDAEVFPEAVARRFAEDDLRVRASTRTLVREELLPDGRTLLAHKRAVVVDGACVLVGASVDVTDWRRADALMVSAHHVLEMIVSGADLPTVLDALCQRMEQHLPGAACSILLLDADGLHLRHAAAPSLPAEYSQKVDGLAIGPLAGSCGTAAFQGEQVIVEDIAGSPLWADYQELAERFGLRACWSTPFFSAGRKVLGTFAIYYRQPRRPDYNELMVISHGTRLASVAVERWQQISELRRLATTDLLTGLGNRAHFMESAETELRRAARFHRALAVLMLDIDFFKRINDRYGHAAGDEALRLFSRVLTRETRAVDVLGRLGGEEFAVILPETGLDAAEQVAERVRLAIEEASFSFQGSDPIRYTVSAGIALHAPGDTLDTLLANADEALYRAKHKGRNRVERA